MSQTQAKPSSSAPSPGLLYFPLRSPDLTLCSLCSRTLPPDFALRLLAGHPSCPLHHPPTPLHPRPLLPFLPSSPAPSLMLSVSPVPLKGASGSVIHSFGHSASKWELSSSWSCLSDKLQGPALRGQSSGSHAPGWRHWMLLSLRLKGHLQLALSGV